MVGWRHRLDGHEFEQAPGDGEGQGSLACCRPWGRKESDMTEQHNTVTLEDSLAVSYQTKHILTRCPRNCAPWYLPKGSTHLHQHKNLHTNVYSFTHNCRNLEASKMSFSS